MTAIWQGGYPEPLTRTSVRARQWFRQYLQALIQGDVKDIAAIRDEGELYRLIELLSGRTANLLNVSNLSRMLGMRLRAIDVNGRARLKAQSGHHFIGGIVLYTGAHCLSLPLEQCYAVPIDRLWA